ncbi:MAG: hypothetical protein MUC87_22275 [Bacteroidia bacterium]|nr:hypothetical protein [Bacteroidia bacterium]
MNYIEWLIQLFVSSHSDITLGFGPNHPTKPNISLQKDIDVFFQNYPTLKLIPEYYYFQLVYSGLFIEEDNYSFSMYGFDEDVTIHLINNPGDITNGEGMLFIADLVIDEPLETIAFALNVNSLNSSDIVYRKRKTGTFSPFLSIREFLVTCAKSPHDLLK